MTDPKLLYQGNPESAQSLGDQLEQGGVDYYFEDDRVVRPRPYTHARARRVVFVERDQLLRAEAIRDQWLASSAVRARELSRRLGIVLLLSLAVPAAWLVVWHFAGEPIPVPRPERLFVSWIVTFAVLAQLEARRRAAERIVMPGSGAA